MIPLIFKSLPCALVTIRSPRVVVTMAWGEAQPAGEYRLYVRRLGEVDDFAYYPAIEVKGGQSTYQLDDLLFDKGTGRYEGRLLVNGVEYTKIQIDFRATNTLLSVENPNV